VTTVFKDGLRIDGGNSKITGRIEPPERITRHRRIICERTPLIARFAGIP